MESLLLKRLQRYFSTNGELFWDVNIGNGFVGERQKNPKIETGAPFAKELWILKKIPVYNSTSKFCNGLFNFWKNWNWDKICACPFCDSIKRERVYKTGHLGLELVFYRASDKPLFYSDC